MKKVFFSVLLLFFVWNGFAQAPMNATARFFAMELDHLQRNYDQEAMDRLVLEYDLVPASSGGYYIGVLALVDPGGVDEVSLRNMGIRVNTRLDGLYSMRVPLDQFSSLPGVEGVQYIEVGQPVAPFMERARPSARVDSVHTNMGGVLSQAYTGKGVIVAIIDWGFDYTHPNFMDTSLTRLRISRAWDQNKLSGPPPPGYTFVTEYVGEDALLAAQTDTTYVFGPMSHGSHVGGIAGGSGAGTPHRGVAYESELIFVSLRRDAPSLVDAFSWISNYAASVNKPFVINMSFGSHREAHDGTCLKNFGINALHGPGRIFVGSAGNNGRHDNIFHMDKDFRQSPGDTLKTVVNFANIPDMFGQALSMWGSEYAQFTAAVKLADHNDSTIFTTPFYVSTQYPLGVDTLLIDGDTLITRVKGTAQNFLNQKPNILLELKYTGNHKVVLMVTSPDSHVHIWSNVRMNSRYTNWGMPLTDNYPGAQEGDNNYGLGEPAGTGANVITVGSYKAKMKLLTGNWLFGHISAFSSIGPTTDGRTKPDISSTGEVVYSSLNSFDVSANPAIEVEHNGRLYPFAALSGTSMSGPTVTGIVALMLQANPQMSAVQAKKILKETARLDDFTGNIGPEGHLQWGWGKANALAAVKAAEIMASKPQKELNQNLFTIYPNPATHQVCIQMDLPQAQEGIVYLYNMEGKMVYQSHQPFQQKHKLDVSRLSPGIHILKVVSGGQVAVKKLVIKGQ